MRQKVDGNEWDGLEITRGPEYMQPWKLGFWKDSGEPSAADRSHSDEIRDPQRRRADKQSNGIDQIEKKGEEGRKEEKKNLFLLLLSLKAAALDSGCQDLLTRASFATETRR